MMAGLTDAEIAALEAAENSGGGLTDEEIAALETQGASSDQFSLNALVQDYIQPAGAFVDKYTGAPTRAAVSAMSKGENPLSAFYKQFGENPELAPTGKDQAIALGLSTTPASERVPSLYSEEGSPLGSLVPPFKKGGLLDVSPAGVAGLGLDVAEDWTNLLPISLAGKATIGAGKKVIPASAKVAVKTGEAVAKGGAAITDAVTGTSLAGRTVEGLETAVDGAKRAGETAGRAFDTVFNPKVSPTFSKSVEIAEKNGIDPSLLSPSVEFGQSSTIARLQKTLAEGPTGEKFLEAHNEGARQIQNAFENKVTRIGSGNVLSEPEAGALIRDKFFERSKEFFDSQDITYKKVQKFAPGLYINRDELAGLNSSLNGLEKVAKGMMKRGITDTTRGQGTQLIRAVNSIRSAKGNFKQTVEQLQEIGKIAYSKTANSLADVPADIQKFRDLYQDIKKAVVNTVRKDVNPEFADELLANNQAMTEYFSNKNVVANAIGSKTMSDEGVFRNLLLSGDTKKIEALKNILGPEELNQLKASFVNSLIKKNADGSFSFDVLFSAMRNKKNQMSALFTPQEIKDLGDIVRLGKEHGLPIMSTSGTGASNAFRELPKAVVRSVVDEGVLNRLKGRARGQVKPEPPKAKMLNQEGSISSELLRTPMNRKKWDNRLKTLQSIAPSSYEERRKRRLQALGE